MDNPQNFLDSIATRDKHEFLKDIKNNNWCNHKTLLLLALELTAGSSEPVAEYGCGDGSSNHLRNYCLEHGRKFLSYDSNEEWANKCGAIYIEDWGTSDVFDGKFSVCFVDMAPGYFRKRAVELLKGKCEILVIHDSEHGGAGDYGLEPNLSKWTYRINYNLTQGGAGVTAISDTIDLNIFDKCTLNEYLLEVL